jgi:hypothetical protein
MRPVLMTIVIVGSAYAQTMTDMTAAAAGGIAGGAAGKKVSEGVTGVFGKVAKQTEKASGTGEKAKPAIVSARTPSTPAPVSNAAPLIEAGPGVPKSGGVPLPPPVHNASERAAVPAPEPVVEPEPAIPPPPPPPEVTPADLKKVAGGMSREDLLKMGAPASRIMMFDDGHLQEIYHYAANNSTFGVVRLVDGAVSAVEVR